VLVHLRVRSTTGDDRKSRPRRSKDRSIATAAAHSGGFFCPVEAVPIAA
jgi:hypothetical protein